MLQKTLAARLVNIAMMGVAMDGATHVYGDNMSVIELDRWESVCLLVGLFLWLVG